MTMELNEHTEEVEEESQTVLPLESPFSLPSEALAALHRYAAVPVQPSPPTISQQPASNHQQSQPQTSFPTPSNKISRRPDSGVPNARLFIGNLPVEKTSKSELEEIFSRYGKILEVSLKASYGFIQYENAEQCANAIQAEQGRAVAGCNIDLKFSKDRAQREAAQREQREPSRRERYERNDYSRDYRSDYRKSDRRDRSPRRRSRSRSPRRRRSRSPSPSYRRSSRSSSSSHQLSAPARGGVLVYNLADSRLLDDFHSSMLRSMAIDSSGVRKQDDLLLQRKVAPDIPDVVLICFSVDKPFVKEVEGSVRDAKFQTECVFLSQRFNVKSVVAQRKSEGAKAILYLERSSQRSGLIHLQSFYALGRITDYQSIHIKEAVDILCKDRDIEFQHRAPAPQSSGVSDLLNLVGRNGLANLLQQQTAASQYQQSAVPQYQQLPPHQAGVGDILSRLSKSLQPVQPVQQNLASLLAGSNQPTYQFPPAQQQTQQSGQNAALLQLLAQLQNK